jgi:hypothetical protein
MKKWNSEEKRVLAVEIRTGFMEEVISEASQDLGALS